MTDEELKDVLEKVAEGHFTVGSPTGTVIL